MLGINGINSNGAKNTDRLLYELSLLGWPVHDVNYPKIGTLRYLIEGRAWHRKMQRASSLPLVRAAKPTDILIAHSYGCLLAIRAMEQAARFHIIFMFAPALDKDQAFPVGANKIYVIYNPQDKALCLTRLLRWHDSGEMGRVGYRGPADARVESVKTTDVIDEPLHHSGYFLPGNVTQWAAWCDERIPYRQKEAGLRVPA